MLMAWSLSHLAYEVSCRIRAVVALRFQSYRPLPIHPYGISAKFGSPVFPKKIQRIFNFSQGLILVYKMPTVKR